MTDSEQPIFEPDALGRTGTAGEVIDAGRGRIFPCPQCGADLEFHIGQQQLACPYCGGRQPIDLPPDAAIVEQDYEAVLSRLRQLKAQGADGSRLAAGEHEIRCESCGANVLFQGTLTSRTCPYCASPLQRDQVHDAPLRIPVDGVLPFLIPRERVAAQLRAWVRSLWFAPNDFQRDGVQGKFHGCYFPYYTFDSITYTRWTGERGDHYWVTVQDGKETKRVRKTRWTSCAGAFQRVFDDVLVLALKDDRLALLQRLEPWPLGKCQPYTPQLLAGLFSRTYDVPVEEGFAEARRQMEAAIVADIRRRIGGDEQRVTSWNTSHRAVTFKHILLPVWLMAYRYKGKLYRVTMNAATGEVQGERPWSWVKITVLVAVILLAALLIVGLSSR
uniref:Zinc ribbon domain-containing protein n=1 Tax=Schlesneria paludicola TaxID=360056 RepID=A0A7C4LNH9_9PLAN